jgi:hypothetical protein
MTKPVTPQDMFELWQRLVNPTGAYPLQSLMFPVLDPKELEKKIAELQVVEHWLKANVNMVQMTMKSLQFQLAMVKGGEKGLKTYAERAQAGAGGDGPETDPHAQAQAPGVPPNPAMWMWDLMTQAAQPAAAAAKPARPPRRKKER